MRLFLRWFFRLLYHQFAWSYDLIAAVVSLGRWKAWVMTALPHLTGPSVLELGHGPGHLQIALHRELGDQKVRIVGIDESKWMGAQAVKRIRRIHYTPLLVNGYAQFLPFSDSAFHQIAATFPSEFIHHPQTLSEIFRVLVPGGSLIVIPAAWITGERWYDRIAAWLFKFTGQVPADLNVLDDNSLTSSFVQAGFHAQVERIKLPTSLVLLIHAHKPEAGDSAASGHVHTPTLPFPLE